jgi:3-oxoacyl-[acyl-carrier-protein] synthase III
MSDNSVQLETQPGGENSRSQIEPTLTSTRTNRLMGVQIVACGSSVPDRAISNEQLKDERGFDPEWIKKRTGILSRRHVTDGIGTSDLAVEAAKRAIESAGVDPADIDLLVLGTFTPDFTCPSTACIVQDRLGLDCAAFDLQAACSGFMYSLATGSQFVATGNSQLALIIGADCNSRIVDQTDRSIAPLFGDGAGAVLVGPGEANQGLVCYQLGADGSGGPLLECTLGGTRNPIAAAGIEAGDHFLKMEGREVFKWAVRIVQESIELVLKKANVTPDEVALFVLHQANIRIVDSAMQKLGIAADKVTVNLDQFGNTSAASIPICLDEALQRKRIQPGDLVLMCGFGGGLTWGTGLFRW